MASKLFTRPALRLNVAMGLGAVLLIAVLLIAGQQSKPQPQTARGVVEAVSRQSPAVTTSDPVELVESHNRRAGQSPRPQADTQRNSPHATEFVADVIGDTGQGSLLNVIDDIGGHYDEGALSPESETVQVIHQGELGFEYPDAESPEGVFQYEAPDLKLPGQTLPKGTMPPEAENR